MSPAGGGESFITLIALAPGVSNLTIDEVLAHEHRIAQPVPFKTRCLEMDLNQPLHVAIEWSPKAHCIWELTAAAANAALASRMNTVQR